MSINKFLENIQFRMIGQEFEYLSSTIDTLIENYQKDFQSEDKKYKKAIEELKKTGEYNESLGDDYADNVTYGQMMEHNLSEPFYKLESFSNIIIESLIIKHLAYIEDILIKISFMVQKNEDEIIPPNHNIQGPFTDMLKAVTYIKLISKDEIKIKDTTDWKMITLLRTLRNELAHGKRSFILKEGVIDDINRVIPLITKENILVKDSGDTYEMGEPSTNPKNEWNCSICSDINVLKEINRICTNFVTDVKSIYSEKYKER